MLTSRFSGISRRGRSPSLLRVTENGSWNKNSCGCVSRLTSARKKIAVHLQRRIFVRPGAVVFEKIKPEAKIAHRNDEVDRDDPPLPVIVNVAPQLSLL